MADILKQFSVGAVGNIPQIFSYSTLDSLTKITQTNYINEVVKQNGYSVGEADMFICSYGAGSEGAILQAQVQNTNITLVAVAGTVTPGGDGLIWQYITGTSQTAQVNHGYVIGNSGLTTITLPGTAPIGSVIQVQGSGAGGWKIQCQTGEIINIGNTPTSSGGSVASSNRYDTIQLVNILANTTWSMAFGVSSDFTIL